MRVTLLITATLCILASTGCPYAHSTSSDEEGRDGTGAEAAHYSLLGRLTGAASSDEEGTTIETAANLARFPGLTLVGAGRGGLLGLQKEWYLQDRAGNLYRVREGPLGWMRARLL